MSFESRMHITSIMCNVENPNETELQNLGDAGLMVWGAAKVILIGVLSFSFFALLFLLLR